MSQNKKKEAMRQIRDEVWNLKNSPLYQERINNNNYPVIGEGDHDARLFFVGEAPGRREAESGRPFCGSAGKILDELLEMVNIERSGVYITNVVKDRPPNNRDPYPEEIELYAPFLDRQIDIIRPLVIVTLGRFAMRYCLERYGAELTVPTISEAHGRSFAAQVSYGDIIIFPLYHPAVAVYNRNQKQVLEDDMKRLVKEVDI